MDTLPVKVEPRDAHSSTVQVTVAMPASQDAEGHKPTGAHLAAAIQKLVDEFLRIREAAPVEAKRRGRLWRTVAAIVGLAGVGSLSFLLAKLLPSLTEGWRLQVAVFVATATVPVALVEGFARLTVKVAKQLRPDDHQPWFDNPGAFLGLVERPLFLGAMVAGYPQFIAVWLVLKGIAGWKTGGTDIRAGRLFQLYLLNNAVSLGGVALGWLVWKLLGLPTY